MVSVFLSAFHAFVVEQCPLENIHYTFNCFSFCGSTQAE